ncbi:MAG: FHA domain-containing protein [Fuerstiella sp.]|nr:FHA domain-containing protein [Fuerstiella sp.]
MVPVTLSVIEGLERGHTFDGLNPPITIGREEDNDIELNDERVSRVHAKIQEDRGQVILTDLNSTNGSRVNGHSVQLRVLRPGDHLQIGRCTLLYGSDHQIAERARIMGVCVAALSPLKHPKQNSRAADSSSSDVKAEADVTGEHLHLPLFPDGPPPVPEQLNVGQAARLADVLTYIHERLSDLTFNGHESDESVPESLIEVPWDRWQNTLFLQRDLSVWLKQIASPDVDPAEDA